MKTVNIGDVKIIMSNPHSKHNYFAWPTVTRLQNGKIAVVASGYRLRHVCPFGKTVISYSEDEGNTYTAPAPIIDTLLDDRDGGILAYGEKDVIVTSFNNTIEFQRGKRYATPYVHAYLDMLTEEEEKKYLGSTFRISHDCGVTFENEIYKSPVTSPHGPCELKDGSLLWVGRMNNAFYGSDRVCAYSIYPDGSMEYVGEIENIEVDGKTALSCEPHAFVLDDGTVLCHIRVQNGDNTLFTIYQSESKDGGKTWTKPYAILSRMGGSPPHIMKHSSGALVCTYAYRLEPSSVRAMISLDNGKTWDTDYVLYVNGKGWDMGYPSTIELKDGSLLTVFYAHPEEDAPAVIMQQKWLIEK